MFLWVFILSVLGAAPAIAVTDASNDSSNEAGGRGGKGERAD